MPGVVSRHFLNKPKKKMPAFLVPIITAFATGLTALILRYIEKKILKLDAEKASQAIEQAKNTTDDVYIKDRLSQASNRIDNIIKNSNGNFAKKMAMLTIFAMLAAATVTAQRIETAITYITTGGGSNKDTALLTFSISNDDTSAFYVGNVLISISANWAQCNNGHLVRASKPAIADTSLHPTQQPYVLSSNGQFSINYIFKTGNRLLCPALASTALGTDTLFIPTATSECTYNQIYSSSQLPSFIQTSTGESSNLSFKREWWRWFITQ